jgi:hypothetical protein
VAGLARRDRDLVGDDEGRVEAHAELADELRIGARVARQLAEELSGAGLGDGAEVLGGLVAGHADAVVAHRDGGRLGVEFEFNGEFAIVLVQTVIGQRGEAQLVGGVGGVGDQLAQEDLAVAVQGIDDEIEQLGDLRLEAPLFFGSIERHGVLCGRVNEAGKLWSRPGDFKSFARRRGRRATIAPHGRAPRPHRFEGRTRARRRACRP